MAPIRQASFTGGELSPSLYGRSDVAAYQAGLRLCRNFLPLPDGALVNRPGTRFVTEVKDSSTAVRLIPFVYSESEAYVLEFGHNYIRFFNLGAPVLSGGVPYEVVTTYTETQLPKLKVAQVGAVMTICHPDHPPRELRRNLVPQPDWTLSAVSFDNYEAYLGGGSAHLISPLPTADATHPAREWTWKVTAVIQHTATGLILETKPNQAFQSTPETPSPWPLTPVPATIACYSDRPVTVSWEADPAALLYEPPDWNAYRVIAYRVYRGRGKAFGYVGETRTKQFVDVGEAPDYTVAPPEGTNPFEVLDYTETFTRTENPAVVAFFEQRRVFASSWYNGDSYRPGTLWASVTGDYKNFDSPFPPRDDSALNFELASLRREEVRSLIGLDRLLAFTSGGVWSIGGGGGEPLAPTSIDAKKHSDIGAAWVQPVLVGDVALYVRASGTGLQELLYAQERGKFLSQDAGIFSRHLFTGYTLVDLTYAREPHGVAWAVRSDGALLSLTYQPEQKVAAWAKHDTDGLVEGVCAVPEGTEDGVYLVVNRTNGGTTKRYVERLTTREVSTAAAGVFLDASLSYAGVATTTVTGLSHLEGRVVWALADGQTVGPLTVVGGAVSIAEAVPDGAGTIHVGLRYDSELELLDIAPPGMEARSKQKLVREVTFEVQASRGLWTGETFERLTEWRQRRVSDSFDPMSLETGRAPVFIRGTWNTGGRAVLRQSDPLPLTVLGVTREVEFGGS